jgi:hypothetical protein
LGKRRPDILNGLLTKGQEGDIVIRVSRAWIICFTAVLFVGCVSNSKKGGKVVNGISLRIIDPPNTLFEGGPLKFHALFRNCSGQTIYLPAETMASSPSYTFKQLGPDGRAVSKLLKAPGWCQGILMGDTAVEIPSGGFHVEWLSKETKYPNGLISGQTYRVIASLRYRIHTPTVVGEFGDPKARKIPDDSVWRGVVESQPYLITVKPLTKRPGKIKRKKKKVSPGKKVSFDFKKTPLAEAVDRIVGHSGIQVTWEAELSQKPITLKMKNAPVRLALEWVGMLAHPEVELEIEKGGRLKLTRTPSLSRRLYDVQALEYSCDAMAKLVKLRVCSVTWKRKGRSIVPHAGMLLVVQSKKVHDRLADFLAEWREISGVESRL